MTKNAETSRGTKAKKVIIIVLAAMATILLAGYLIPEKKAMPCCRPNDYNHDSFWAWPWTRGESGCAHYGVDIFGKVGTPVVFQTGGIVIFSGMLDKTAGNAVCVLGPKWRIHQYFHLQSADAKFLHFVKPNTQIGTLGKTGNAATTPAHVHYGIVTPIPYIWKYNDKIGADNQPSRYNWMKMFWLNPVDHLPTE